VTEPSLLATFQVAETIDSFNASNFTLQLAQASGVAASAITLNIVSGSLTVTASFYISSADRSRVQDTLDQQASALSAMLGVTVLSTPTIQLVEPQSLPNVGDSAAALLTLDGALPSSPTLLMIALILAGVANVACAIGCAMYVVLRRRRIRRAKERFGAAAERAAVEKHSIDIEMTKHPCAAIAASHLVQPFQSLLSQPPSAAIAEAPLPSRRARRPVDEPPAPGVKLVPSIEAKPVPSAEAASTVSSTTCACASSSSSAATDPSAVHSVPWDTRVTTTGPGAGTKDETSFEGVSHAFEVQGASRSIGGALHAFEVQGASRSIGGAAPVVMPRLDEDFFGSVLPEVDVANFYAEFEAELDA